MKLYGFYYMKICGLFYFDYKRIHKVVWCPFIDIVMFINLYIDYLLTFALLDYELLLVYLFIFNV